MPLTSTLFRIIVHFLVSLVWFDGVAAGKGSSPTEGKPAKPWHRGGQFFKRMIKNPLQPPSSAWSCCWSYYVF